MDQPSSGALNRPDGAAARAYHDATRHSLASLRANTHRLEWSNQPLPFKIYTSLEPIPLPTDLAPSAGSALDAIAGSLEVDPDAGVDRAVLARLCYYANGVTRVLQRPGGEAVFRAAACTGALYHIELYVVCQELADLPAGVYHYGAHEHALFPLRQGDVRAALVEATGAEPHVARAPVVLVCTSTFWRNAWKYQARAYRHSFWDTGTILANLLAVAAARQVSASVVLGFADATVNHVLDVDGRHEAAICLVALGARGSPPPPTLAVPALNYPTRRLSPVETDYPAILEMHTASSLTSGSAAAAWRAQSPLPEAVSSFATHRLASPPIETVITRRGSSRRFTRQPISGEQLEVILAVATRPIAADVGGPLTTPYLIVNAVDGLGPGTYVYDRRSATLAPLRLGDFRDTAGYLDLGQELAADAAINVYSLTDLHTVLPRLGNRGYRAAQLEGAIEGGRLYLAAYALGLGATGLTFFDDDVTRFFSPHAADKSVMFLTGIGHPARRSAAAEAP
jgi:SagB-type dehydrogenase family enzyme